MDFEARQRALDILACKSKFFKFKDKIYKIHNASREIKALGVIIYNDTVDNIKYSEYLQYRQDLEKSNKFRNLWTNLHEEDLKQKNKLLEDLKVSLFHNLLDLRRRKQIKNEIRSVNKVIERLLVRKNSLNFLTIENHATIVKDQFIIGLSISDINDNFLFNIDNIFHQDMSIIQVAINHIVNTMLNVSELRELARTEPWMGLYYSNKYNVFDCAPIDMTAEQKSLISYSRMYENAGKHPEAPPIQEVIDDDDMFDGWCILQGREQNKNQKNQFIGKNMKHGGAGEVFLMTNKEDIEAINELNDFSTRMTRASRQNLIQQKGSIQEHQLPDVQLQLKQQLKEKVKRK